MPDIDGLSSLTFAGIFLLGTFALPSFAALVCGLGVFTTFPHLVLYEAVAADMR